MRPSVPAAIFACLLSFAPLLAVPSAGIAQAVSPPEGPPVPREVEVPEALPVPDDLEIVVVREDLIPGQFRILDIRLSREVGEDVLGTLANLLRDSDEATYQRTYIVYYLPGMEPGAGGWATSHFAPELEVRILEPGA